MSYWSDKHSKRAEVIAGFGKSKQQTKGSRATVGASNLEVASHNESSHHLSGLVHPNPVEGLCLSDRLALERAES